MYIYSYIIAACRYSSTTFTSTIPSIPSILVLFTSTIPVLHVYYNASLVNECVSLYLTPVNQA